GGPMDERPEKADDTRVLNTEFKQVVVRPILRGERTLIRGRGTFRKRHVVEESLKITVRGTTRDARLLEWIREPHVVVPVLQTMVRSHDRRRELRRLVLDLRRRVAEREGEWLRQPGAEEG